MFQLGKLAIQSTVSTLGTVAIAAQAMTNILENLNGIAAIGVGVGLMTIVGQCLGAGRKDEAIYYIRKLCVIAEVILICSCLLVFLLVRPITILGGMEAESAKMCIHMISWIVSLFIQQHLNIFWQSAQIDNFRHTFHVSAEAINKQFLICYS